MLRVRPVKVIGAVCGSIHRNWGRGSGQDQSATCLAGRGFFLEFGFLMFGTESSEVRGAVLSCARPALSLRPRPLPLSAHADTLKQTPDKYHFLMLFFSRV